MKFLSVLILLFSLSGTGLKGQIRQYDQDTVVETDGQFFMPYAKGIIEKSTTVAPVVARMKPSLANLIKKNLNKCTSAFLADSLFKSLSGLKAVIKEEVLPEQGISESVKWIPAHCSISLFTTLSRKDQPWWDSIPDAWLTVHLNNPLRLVGNPVIHDIYLEPVLTDTTLSWTEFDRISIPERILVAKKTPLTWFEPVSREDFILTLISFFQGSIEKAEKRTSPPHTVASVPSSRKDLEKLKFYSDLEKIRRIDPELADRLMKEYLDAEILESRDQSGQVDHTIVLNSWKEAVRRLKAEMNAMSPLERKSQAWWSDTEDSNVSGLTPSGYSGSRPLVRLNKNLIDRTRPGSSVQLIIMECSLLPGSEFSDKEGFNLVYDKLSGLWNSQQLRQHLLSLIR